MMRKIILGLVLWFVLGAFAAACVGIGPSASASQAPAEHIGTVVADCDTITGTFTNFPQGEQSITFTWDDGFEADGTFQGPAGSVTVPWAPGPGDHSITASWTADGGGSATGSFNGDGCVPVTTEPPSTTAPPPTTTEPPPPTTEVPPPTTEVPPPPPTTDPPTVDPCGVSDPRPGCPQELARTGGVNWLLTGIGIMLIASGLVFMRLRRRTDES